jgi:hypothetical protein
MPTGNLSDDVLEAIPTDDVAGVVDDMAAITSSCVVRVGKHQLKNKQRTSETTTMIYS